MSRLKNDRPGLALCGIGFQYFQVAVRSAPGPAILHDLLIFGALMRLGILLFALLVGTIGAVAQERFSIPIDVVSVPDSEPDPAAELRQIADLEAQQAMAVWAQWMFWATVGTLIISAGALAGLVLSLRQTARAIQDNREVGEVQTQAYVHAASAKFGDFANVIVSLKNTGLTPATHFSVAGSIHVVRRGEVSDSIGFTNGPFKTFSALGAGEELSVSVGPSADISPFRTGNMGKDDILLVCGQIVYCTIFNHDHETQFAFYVDQQNRSRFRRPTANIRAYWRIPSSGLPPATLHDPNATAPQAIEDQ